ncbi:MAG TPA: alpha/beta hydrolase [Ohtaekwangia sp.]
MRAVYIIPGYLENTKMKAYQDLMQVFRRKKVRPIPVDIRWKYKTMSDYVGEFLAYALENPHAQASVFGFSFGGMIALLAAKYIKPQRLYIASLSPYFREDIKHLREADRKALGKRRIEDFKKFSFQPVARTINCPVVFMVGEYEPDLIFKRVTEANAKIKKSKLIVIKGARHDFADQRYNKNIVELISRSK